jgi:hypothetical protein
MNRVKNRDRQEEGGKDEKVKKKKRKGKEIIYNNDIGLHDTSSIATYILWYQLIPHC